MYKSFLLIFALLVPVTLYAGDAQDVHEYMLKNGLKVIVKEDHRAPVVVSQVWYKVGSSYENDGMSGISHVLEHMMFKGTRKHPAGEFSRIISENGGRENAFTGRDYTAYFQQLEKSRLHVSFELESDRMRNLSLRKEDYAKEIQVVMEERRMRTDDDPQSLTEEQFTATAFVNSPYHHSVIGWMDDLENLTVEDVRKWYEKWYAPNNATLVVVGDVDPDNVFKLAKKYFGPLKPSVLAPPKPRNEIEQLGERRIVVKAPAELPYIIMGYKAPVLSTADEPWEPYALEVLAGVLDGGDSARFARELVRDKQIAASVNVGYNMTARKEDLFTLDGTPARGHTISEIEAALKEQIKRLHDQPVTADELARIKAQVIASNVYQRDSVFYQAMQIGTLETVGQSWKLLDEYVDKIQKVTPEQVQKVARKYLTDDKLTVATLDPLPLSEKPARNPAMMGGPHDF